MKSAEGLVHGNGVESRDRVERTSWFAWTLGDWL